MTTIKLELNGYWGRRSAHVTGELVKLYDIIRRKLTETGCTVGTDRPPHVEVTNLARANDMAAYDSINNNMIDVFDMNLWTLSNVALMLNTGKTIYDKHTHFTVAYFPDRHTLTRDIVETIIKESINEYVKN